MSAVTFVRSNGIGEQTEEEVTLTSSEFSVKIDGTLYKPAVTTNLEIENDGETETTSDQCGHSSRSRTGDKGWLIRIEGIVSGNDDRYGNLSMQMMRDVVATADEIEIRSDLYSGSQVVSNTVISQPNDLHSIETRDTDGPEQAYEFQIQLGETESEGN